jgi:hypothetical protein
MFERMQSAKNSKEKAHKELLELKKRYNIYESEPSNVNQQLFMSQNFMYSILPFFLFRRL